MQIICIYRKKAVSLQPDYEKRQDTYVVGSGSSMDGGSAGADEGFVDADNGATGTADGGIR